MVTLLRRASRQRRAPDEPLVEFACGDRITLATPILAQLDHSILGPDLDRDPVVDSARSVIVMDADHPIRFVFAWTLAPALLSRVGVVWATLVLRTVPVRVSLQC